MNFRRTLTFVVMCAGMFFVLLDVTIVNVALPSIGRGTGAAQVADLLPGTLAVSTTLYAGRAERARAIGAWAAIGSLALPAGPVIGGVLVQFLGRPWVVWINVPVIAVVVAGILYAVRESEPERRPGRPRAAVAAAAPPAHRGQHGRGGHDELRRQRHHAAAHPLPPDHLAAYAGRGGVVAVAVVRPSGAAARPRRACRGPTGAQTRDAGRAGAARGRVLPAPRAASRFGVCDAVPAHGRDRLRRGAAHTERRGPRHGRRPAALAAVAYVCAAVLTFLTRTDT